MALDIPHCKKIKEQKSMSFLGPKIWNKSSSNIETAVTTASFYVNCKSEQFIEFFYFVVFIFILISLCLYF